jgi:hypothetical protein
LIDEVMLVELGAERQGKAEFLRQSEMRLKRRRRRGQTFK